MPFGASTTSLLLIDAIVVEPVRLTTLSVMTLAFACTLTDATRLALVLIFAPPLISPTTPMPPAEIIAPVVVVVDAVVAVACSTGLDQTPVAALNVTALLAFKA